MELEDFHCDVLELSFRIGAEEIDKDALITDIGNFGGDIKDDSEFALAFGSKENASQQHSHMSIRFRTENRVQVRIAYHNSRGIVDDDKPPFMEDCAMWLGNYIKRETVPTNINAFYVFDETFESGIVRIPYPLTTTEKSLVGSLVTGIAIEFPQSYGIQNALMQRSKDGIGLSVFKFTEINLKQFNFYEQLKDLDNSIMPLLKKREGAYDTNKDV